MAEPQLHRLGRDRDGAIRAADEILAKTQAEYGRLSLASDRKSLELPATPVLFEMLEKRRRRGASELLISNAPAPEEIDLVLCTLAVDSEGYSIDLNLPIIRR